MKSAYRNLQTLRENRKEMEEKLIEYFRRNPCLYSKNHKKKTNSITRNQKLHELSRKLNVPVRKIKDRWRTLRDTYQKEKKRLSGVEDPVGVRKWKWMDHMTFLDDTTPITPTTSEKLFLSETTKEYYDETSGEYDNTISSWSNQFNCEDNNEYDDGRIDNEEGSFVAAKVKLARSDSMSSLLEPLDQKPTKKLKKITKFEANVNSDGQVYTDTNRDGQCYENEVLWEMPPIETVTKRSSIQLFFDSLAAQIEDAQLTPFQMSALQIEFLKTLQNFLPNNK